MPQYDYPISRDATILQALLEVWDPPPFAQPFVLGAREHNEQHPDHAPLPTGNCIRAAKFTHHLLTLLHVQCDVTATRIQVEPGINAAGKRTEWHKVEMAGDCGSYAAPSPRAFPAHAVVTGHHWLLDPSGQFIDAPGPVLATPAPPAPTRGNDTIRTLNGNWRAQDGNRTIYYSWAPGLVHDLCTCPGCLPYGTKTHAARIARDVRRLAGPCRKPYVYCAG